MQEFELIEEELIHESAAVRQTSRRLRRRILRAAKQAERRARTRRRILVAASFLLPIALLCGWLQGMAGRNTAALPTADIRIEDAAAAANALHNNDAWSQAVSTIREREKQSKTIRSGLY